MANKTVTIKAKFVGDINIKEENAVLAVSAESCNWAGTNTCSENRKETESRPLPHHAAASKHHVVPMREFTVAPGVISVTYSMGEDVLLWDEYEPNLYILKCVLKVGGAVADTAEVVFGMREFKAAGNKFAINGRKTFLRGKHDGMIFPLTGAAPTTFEEWLRVLSISKQYGINHYRFHTCCPPEAAFTAADILGIYMEPELPFWGTITDEGDENHNPEELEYLINEGYNILKYFGNHPSFVMMSLGNELWGSQKKLNEMLKAYKTADPRHLYTQGSNNFQFVPVILENEDFFCGVRFSKDRLIRGSYAMCDAPLGHVQVAVPGTMKDYDREIRPDRAGGGENAHADRGDNYGNILENGVKKAPVDKEIMINKETFGDKENITDKESKTCPADIGPGIGDSESCASEVIDIQFGTGTKKVVASAQSGELIPEIPVVSHEIGQYAVFPNFEEIKKYTGPLKAKNMEVFKRRLTDAGLDHLADKYFRCSGKLAVSCYKEELEAAFRSRELAGFQILDLQDFTGQGTALVGILDAFMDSKGLVSPEEWRTFCSDAVLLARFEKYNYEAGEQFSAHIELCYYRNKPLGDARLRWKIRDASCSPGDCGVIAAGEFDILCGRQENNFKQGNYFDLCDISVKMPDVSKMKKLEFSMDIEGTDIWKRYDLWLYPKDVQIDTEGICVCRGVPEALSELRKGKKVLLFPDLAKLENSIEGFYCTDFWCYPMFRSISESMGKKVPVGTMGLLNDNTHPVFGDFPCEEHSTYQWWHIVMNSRPVILDGTPKDLQPMVQTIDNFERNHKLGTLFECVVSGGKLLVCSCDADKIRNVPEGRQFLYSIVNYMKSDRFMPRCELSEQEVEKLLR